MLHKSTSPIPSDVAVCVVIIAEMVWYLFPTALLSSSHREKIRHGAVGDGILEYETVIRVLGYIVTVNLTSLSDALNGSLRYRHLIIKIFKQKAISLYVYSPTIHLFHFIFLNH